jgi:hypothetical protein
MILKTQPYTTHLQGLQVTTFGFVNKSSSDLFLYQEPDIYKEKILMLAC